MKWTFEANRHIRIAILVAGYVSVLFAAFVLAYALRFDFAVPAEFKADRRTFAPLLILLQLGFLASFRQFGSLLTYFSVPDLARVAVAMGLSNLLVTVLWYGSAGMFAPPRGVILADFVMSVAGLCCFRLGLRMYRERLNPNRKSPSLPQQRIVIVGAGDAGASLAREFINAPSRGFRPVAFFDDDAGKHGKLLHGVPVLGSPEAFSAKADDLDVVKAVIAMPSAPARRVREVVQLFTQKGIKVETLPSLEELASGKVRASRIRPVEVQDLLGREAVDLDSAAMRKQIEGRVALVTGAGGSIGGELCRQIAALNPKRLLMVEQAEGALFNIEQELNELGLGTIALPLVADILDRERMEYIFSRYEPEVIFHAAAHKHVYLMERQPAEAIHNNVLGTRLLAKLAAAHGVAAFVFISTDKAINPTSVMGATKRLAEIQMMAIAAAQAPQSLVPGPVSLGRGHLSSVTGQSSSVGSTGHSSLVSGHLSSTAETEGRRNAAADGRRHGTPEAVRHVESAMDQGRLTKDPSPRVRAATKFMAVRFGNVLGSSGSVIPIFKRQIANGGPVTVTHPDVTRYFMTIPEAVGLVLQSFVQGKGGEIFVLDMGHPVKIVDLARQMIELSGFKPGDDIEIKFTGLKPGEKLFEELQHHTEDYAATEHPRIMRFTSNAMFSESGVHELEQQLHGLEPNELKVVLRRLVPEYTPFLD